jgi:hypothetical protein
MPKLVFAENRMRGGRKERQMYRKDTKKERQRQKNEIVETSIRREQTERGKEKKDKCTEKTQKRETEREKWEKSYC